MSALSPARFDEFVDAVIPGRTPFPWQRRLLRELAEGSYGGPNGSEPGRWPDLLALPTGAGKTSLIDVAVYAMALGVPVPRRIFFVVDRRVIVQQAAEHARTVAARLATGAGILAEVADALRATAATLVGTGSHDPDIVPLRVAELRGAIEQDRAWTLRPDQPAVIATTVDQLGSRLLFRGYGVSERMRPIHAGLVGDDALIVLDEVHLARPFAALLHSLRSRFLRLTSALRWQVVELSATPDPAMPTGRRFALDDDDRTDPVLRRRLQAAKPARAVTIRPSSDPGQDRAALVDACVRHTLDALTDARVRTVAVVVNRVRSAALIADALASRDIDAVLVTGRMRELHRRDVLARLAKRAGAGRSRDPHDRPFVVVATQTIEAGADYDFDVLVTECASIDALVQRFGRVNRRGELGAQSPGADATPPPAAAANPVVGPPVSVVIGWDRLIGADDPIYGAALGATWQWLRGRELDFGADAVRVDELEPALFAPARAHPTLLRPHLDRWVRTAPRPDADPEIAPFLHGFDSGADPEVELVWRADLIPAVLRNAAGRTVDTAAVQGVIDQLVAVPPSRGEGVSVPLSKARAWLRQPGPDQLSDPADAELSDVEGARASAVRGAARNRPFVLWRGDRTLVTYAAREIRPGDVIVVPAGYGGLTRESWQPDDQAPVADIAVESRLADGELVLRLNPMAHAAYARPAASERATTRRRSRLQLDATDTGPRQHPVGDDGLLLPCIPTPAYVEANELDAAEAIRGWLEAAMPHLDLPGEAAAALDEWSRGSGPDAVSVVGSELAGTEAVPTYVVTIPLPDTAGTAGEIDSEPWRSSNAGIRYGLDAHLADVERWSGRLATACGLPADLTAVLAAAGALHDLGKADPRFQALLREGELALGQPLLAKSAVLPFDRARSARAQDAAGYPPGLRHELASLALLEHAAVGTGDDELVRYLVATHHGHCRPFAPAQIDPTPVALTYTGQLGQWTGRSDHQLGSVGGDTTRRFTRLIDRYGYHRLAYLETLLRLADHGASRNIRPGGQNTISLRLDHNPAETPASTPVSTPIELPALQANSAHGFLAAIGVVEALHRAGLDARLSWTAELFPHARLHGPASIDEAIAAVLRDRDRRLGGFVLDHPPGAPYDTLGRPAVEAAAWWQRAAAQPDDHPDLDLFCGLLVEGGRTGKGASKPTHFDLTAGQAKFLKIVRSIAQALNADLLDEAMRGPWQHRSTLSTLRFEATGERLAALRGVPPSLDAVRGVPGADWLAFLALSFYPLSLRPAPDRDRVVTPACDANWNRSAFRWPVWRQPLARAAIAALVTDPSLVAEAESSRRTSSAELAARGIPQLWQSGLVRSAQGYGSFTPAKMVASAAVAHGGRVPGLAG